MFFSNSILFRAPQRKSLPWNECLSFRRYFFVILPYIFAFTWVVFACFFPFPGTALLLPVLKKNWISGFRRIAMQRPLYIRANAVQPSSLFFWVAVSTLGYWQVNDSLIQKIIERKVLQVPLFSHKAIQWGCPVFCQNLHSLHIHFINF